MMAKHCARVLISVVLFAEICNGAWDIDWTDPQGPSPPPISTTRDVSFGGEGEGTTVRVEWGRNVSGGGYTRYDFHDVTLDADDAFETTFTANDDNGPWDTSPPLIANHFGKLFDSAPTFKTDCFPVIVQ